MLKKDQMAVYTKITCQICCKQRGALWAVYNKTPNLLVIGFDLWRKKATPPVGAMVAAMEQYQTRHFSQSFPQQGMENISTQFTAGFRGNADL
jgi:hypothetical protein